MNLHNFNSNTKSWKMYTNTLTSISGDDLLVMPSYGKDIILEVSANNDIFFKKGTVTKRFDNLVSDYLETSFNSLNSQVQYILQEISGNSVKDFITSGISNDLLIKSYDGRDIILEVSGNSEIIFKRGDFSYNLDDLIGGGSQSSDYATYNILDITGKIIFTDNSNAQQNNNSSSSNIILTSISGDIIPSINNTFKLGDISKNWSNAYISDLSVSNINGQPYINNANYVIDYINSTFSPVGQDLSGEPTDGQAIISYFGYSVALSQDGTIMGVTAPLNNGTGAVQGSARIYKYNDVSWVQLGQDIDGEANNDLQANIKLSNDGTIAALGSWYNSGIGSIRVFKYNDISWIQLGQDIDGTAADDEFGFSISLSGNGKIIAIGAPSNDTSYNQAGQVRVYSYIENDNSWNIIGTFNGFGFNNRSGISVSLSSSGTILAISSPFLYNSDNLADMPRVDIYEFSNNVWSPKGPTIYGSYLGADSKFGNNIELSKDGLILTINELYNPSNNNLGRVLTYKYNSTDNSWNKLDSTINIVVDSSNSVWEDPYIALSSDGTIMALGMAHSNSTNRGLVRLYKLINNEWIKVGPDILSDANEGLFGYGLSLSSDGSILAIGSPQEGLSSEGYVRVYKVDYSYNNVIQYYQFTNIKANNIEISGNIVGNIVPLNATSSTLGTSIKYWSNAYINDISTTNIEVSGNIVPLNANSSTLGTSIKPWSNAYIIDVSVTNISVSDNIILNNIILNICGGTITNINKLTAPASNYKITSTTRLYQEISGDISWNTVNGYYGLAKDAYPSLNPYSSGVKAVQNWTGRGQGIELNFWQSVCWSPELRIFVAVAITGDNRVMTSADGTSWTSASDGVELNEWTSICWSPELEIFVAVAISGDNRVMTSSYGTSWTSSSEGVELNYWSGLCWSPQLRIFVAVAINGDNRVMTSSNGTSWTTTSEGVELISWSSVCWSAELGIFVAVASSGDNRVMTSSNGTSWTSSSEGVDLNEWTSVCWSPEFGIFVAVASSGDNRVMTSANGTSWTPILGGIENVSQSVEFNSWQSVCWSAELGIFIAVARTENYRVMYSANGTSWLSFGAYDIELNDWTSVCWSPELGIFVAVAISGDNRVMTSSLKGRPPTSYNVFDSTSNSIDENGTWTFSNISILENIVPVSDNYSNLGLDTHKWASAHIASLNTNSISILENIVPINDNYSNLGLETNRWNNAHTNYLNTGSISILENIVPVHDNYSNLGLDTHRWNNAYIASLNTNSISIVDNLVPVNDNYSNLGLDTNRWNNAYINALNVTETVTFGGSNLYVPSSFTIDPMGHGDNTGTVTINGNLVVQGVTTTINSSVLDISDKMIVLASNASNSLQADGAGFEISGAKVNFLYNNSSATFRSSIGISISGNVVPVTSTGSLGSSLIPWSNAYIRDVSTTNIEVSGNIVPLRDMSSNLGSSLKRWNNVFVNDLSVNTINGQAYSAGGGTSSYTSITSGTDIGNFNILGAIIPPEGTVDTAGYSVAINDIGDVIAIGSPKNRGPSNNAPGLVRVYYYNGTSWIQRGLDIDGEGSNDRAGHSVALNSDGTIVAIGAPHNTGVNGVYSGSVRVYKWNNTSWIPRGQELDGELVWDTFSGMDDQEFVGGASTMLSLNSDGTILAAGSWSNNQGTGGAGHVRVYKYTTTWAQIGLDIDGKTWYERSGTSISLNSDGTLVAIGAPLLDPVAGQTDRGGVRVYKWNGSSWQQRGTTICGETFDYFTGLSVSLNAVGDILAFGAPYSVTSGIGESAGLVKVYKWTNDISWVKQGQSIYGRTYNQKLGTTVSLNSDGNILAIGSPYSNFGYYNGEVIVYKWNAVLFLWEQYANILPNLSQGERFGLAIALNAAGNRLVVGAPYANNGAGYTMVYQYSAGSSSLVSTSITPSVNNTYTLGRDDTKWKYAYITNITVDYMNASRGIISSDSSIGPANTEALDLGSSTNKWREGRFMSVYAYSKILPGSDNASTIGYSNQRFANIYTMALTVNTTGYTSDDRLKHNEVIINNGLDIIDQLTPKFYQKTQELLDAHYNGDLSGHNWTYETGLIAQELLQIRDLSFVVSGGDYYDTNNFLITQPYSVNYNSVFVYGLAAIKELHQKVKAQETSISTLQTSMLEQQATINSLLTRLQALEASAN